MTKVFIDGNEVTPEQGRTYVIRKALMSGADKDETESLYQRGFNPTVEGEDARDQLLAEGVEIVMCD